VKKMMGTIDDALENFADHPNLAWARQAVVVGTDASNAENRLFELLNMNLGDAMWAAPFSVTAKSDIVYVLLRMVDDRKGMDFCMDVGITHHGEMVRPMDVVGYEAAKRIVEKVIAWAERNGERMLAEKARAALGYREQAEWQGAAMRVLIKVDERRIDRYVDLERLLEEAGCPNPRKGDRLVESVAEYIGAFGHAREKEELRNRHIPGVANCMKETGMRLPGSRGVGTSSSRSGSYYSGTKAAAATPKEESRRIENRASNAGSDYEKKWKQEAVREGAIDALLHRLGKAGSDGETADAFRSTLNRISGWGNLRQLKRMKELGCSVSEDMIRGAEERMGITKPVCGKRGRDSRRELVELEGRKVWRVWRKKGNPGGLKNGEKRRIFREQRAVQAGAQLRA
jgi:hypothetical protein